MNRYMRLLAQATDEPKRLALIELLIAEGARGKLAEQMVREKLPNLGPIRNR
jgi:hypothetical protein